MWRTGCKLQLSFGQNSRDQRNMIESLDLESHLNRAKETLKKILTEEDKNYQSRSSSARRRGEYCPHYSPCHTEQSTQIVLKFTTVSEPNASTPSFFVGTNGARIGRELINEVHVPEDTTLAPVSHSVLQYSNGHFYMLDCGHDFAAGVRIGVGGQKKKWIMEAGTQFSAGQTVICCAGCNSEGDMILRIKEGPLKGEERIVGKQKACSIGRSSESTIYVPDKELSHWHSNIQFDEGKGQYILTDCSSTNGTYVQLVGPYSGRQPVNLNDHILVGRTCFSINRYDFGVSEEKGLRQTMEDSCTIVQHLNVTPLCIRGLFPHSFFGVFDGHGGAEASTYLAINLHINVADALLSVSKDLIKIMEDFQLKIFRSTEVDKDAETPLTLINDLSNENCESLMEELQDCPFVPGRKCFDIAITENIDSLVIKSLKVSFLDTDENFISHSKFPEHGSTATTALILGKLIP